MGGLGEAATATDVTTGIIEVKQEVAPADDALYNLAGQKVSESYKGIVIKNGVKVVK
jgi:hypothetical protein